MVGPDLNVNGDVGEADVGGSDGGPSAASEAQPSPAQGNSMLGKTHFRLRPVRHCMAQLGFVPKSRLKHKIDSGLAKSLSTHECGILGVKQSFL